MPTLSSGHSAGYAVIVACLVCGGCEPGGGATIPPPVLAPIPADALDADPVETTSEPPDAVADGAGPNPTDSVPTPDTLPNPDTLDPSPCPEAMTYVAAQFCIDRWEASLEVHDGEGWVPRSPYLTVGDATVRAVTGAGQIPQGYISGDEAGAACALSGKRLCTSEEWLLACQGDAGHTWPYGPEYLTGACHDTYPGGHPVVDYFGTSDGIWDPAHMNDPGINQQPGTVAAAGSYAQCVSAWGVFDLHGNLHEWVADAGGVFRGGFYADASINGPGCLYDTTAHSTGYHDYSTGFRCCLSP